MVQSEGPEHPDSKFDERERTEPESTGLVRPTDSRAGSQDSVDLKSETHPDESPILAAILERLVESLEPARIYLIGSRARGNADEHSDYDILVLVDGLTKPAYRLSQRGYEALRGIPAAVDVLVRDRATFDARLHLRASFPATVTREGRLLYAASKGS